MTDQSTKTTTPTATTGQTKTQASNELPVDVHDRVASLSLRADGTPDQLNPELIGDKDAALAATKEQFRQQAVSAVDASKRAELGLGATEDDDTSDAVIDELKATHEKVAEAAEKRAEQVVNDLHQG